MWGKEEHTDDTESTEVNQGWDQEEGSWYVAMQETKVI